MNEFIFSAAWKVIALVFAAGVVWGELKAIRKDIARLEQKQDKYNHEIKINIILITAKIAYLL